MNVPLLDLKPQTDLLRDEIVEAVSRVIDSTQYILGPEVESFERAVAEYCQTGDAVGVSSGTDALLISLMTLGIGPGDAVLTSPYTFFATLGSIMRVGATPVFADIDPVTMNISPTAMAEALALDRRGEAQIKALLPVHLFGQCADMQSIMDLAEEYDLPVIEDCAQAIGAECPFEENGETAWRKAGAMGIAGCFSFFPSKNLGGIGDGGMVTCSDEEFVRLLKIYRNHGANPKYFHSLVGGNFRLDPVQACVLNIKLRYLEHWHSDRRRNAGQYTDLFADRGLAGEEVILPEAIYGSLPDANDRNFHIYNQFVIRVPRRDELLAYLQSRDIGCEVYYPLCLHQQECLRNIDTAERSYPAAEQAAREALALPIFPELSIAQQEYVVDAISSFYRS